MGRSSSLLWIALAVMAAAIALSSERNRLALSLNAGSITRGDRTLLAVSVGMPADAAAVALTSQGLVNNAMFRRSGDGLFACYRGQPPDQSIAVYEDHTWRRGVVCLTLEEGRVTRVDWHYNLLLP